MAFDVKDALVTKISANATLLAIPDFTADNVFYGFSGRPEEFPRLAVQIGEISWESERDVTLGGLKRDEAFYITLAIHSHVPGDTQQVANGRVKAMAQAIEILVRDPRWSQVAHVIMSGFVPQYLAEGTDAEGRGAILMARVYVTARI